MAFGYFIGGFLGFMSGGPLGALAGAVLGGWFEKMLKAVNTPETQGTFDGQGGYQSRAYNGYTQEQIYQGQRNSFLFSLLVLASYIIKADGKVMHSEMELVRGMLRQNFGEQAVRQGDQIMRQLFDEQDRIGTQAYKQNLVKACQQIAMHMDHSGRLQLLNFLVMIAQADGSVVDAEITALRDVAASLGISAADVESMLNLRS